MSITDELREYIWQHATNNEELRAIADRIDTEHEKHIASVMNDALYHANEKDMADLGWIRLPKDADGEYIHIGDVMAYADNTKPMQVVALVPPSVFMVEDGPRYADMCRHYHAPTVEDELTDLCERVWESALLGGTWSDSPVESYITEYAAKLQLKA